MQAAVTYAALVNGGNLIKPTLIREEIINKTELGSQISSIINSGELVSDEIVSN